MNKHTLRAAVIAAVSLSLLAPPPVARAENAMGDIVTVGTGLFGVGFLVKYGIFAVTHDGRHLTGCTEDGPNGLQVRPNGAYENWNLLGNTAGIHAGQRVRVSGKRELSSGSGNRGFLVEKVDKVYGDCM